MKRFFNEHKEPIMLILRCAVALTLFITAVVNYNRLTNIDMRALVDGAGNIIIAIALILGIYAVKSMLFIIPASMIYIYVGMAFSPLSAIAVNFAGIFLEVTLTYLLGLFLGGSYVEKRLRGKPAGEKVMSFLQDNKKLSALFVVRVLPVFPIDFVSLFLGAMKLPFWKYILISMFGIMPRVAMFTVVGDTLYDYVPMHSIIKIIICCIPLVMVYWVIKFIRKRKKRSEAEVTTSSGVQENES